MIIIIIIIIIIIRCLGLCLIIQNTKNIQHDFLPSGSDEDLGKTSGGLLNVKKKKKSEKPGYKMFDADDSDSEPVLYDDSNR